MFTAWGIEIKLKGAVAVGGQGYKPGVDEEILIGVYVTGLGCRQNYKLKGAVLRRGEGRARPQTHILHILQF